MSQIRSQNTELETDFLKLLSATLYPKGYRYRKHHKKLPGKPDVVFSKYKLAIFIDGDFWHGYNFKKLGKQPPKKYWTPKIERNVQRDKEVTRELRKRGWKVVRIWEHDIKKDPQKAVGRLETLEG